MSDDGRPNNREVENENQRPGGEGHAPRPATEPRGSEGSSDSPRTKTDPATGETSASELAEDVEALSEDLERKTREPLRGETVRGLAP